MNKVLLAATFAWVAIGIGAFAGIGVTTDLQVLAQSAAQDHKAVVDKYCVTCHNQRLKIPAGAPLYLDTADVTDPAKDPATWERSFANLASAPCLRLVRRILAHPR